MFSTQFMNFVISNNYGFTFEICNSYGLGAIIPMGGSVQNMLANDYLDALAQDFLNVSK